MCEINFSIFCPEGVLPDKTERYPLQKFTTARSGLESDDPSAKGNGDNQQQDAGDGLNRFHGDLVQKAFADHNPREGGQNSGADQRPLIGADEAGCPDQEKYKGIGRDSHHIHHETNDGIGPHEGLGGDAHFGEKSRTQRALAPGKSAEKAGQSATQEEMFPVKPQPPQARQQFEQSEDEHQKPHGELDGRNHRCPGNKWGTSMFLILYPLSNQTGFPFQKV